MKKLMYAGIMCLGMLAMSCGPTKTDENENASPGDETGTDRNPENTSDSSYNDYNSTDSVPGNNME